jgi:hypothetical protein
VVLALLERQIKDRLMFMRLFITDFFIHGKGGGRYEEVSEHIIKEFFKIEAAPYEVASATMNLNKTKWFSVPDIDEKELELKLRDSVYSPEKFLDHSHPLVLQKKELQSKNLLLYHEYILLIKFTNMPSRGHEHSMMERSTCRGSRVCFPCSPLILMKETMCSISVQLQDPRRLR